MKLIRFWRLCFLFICMVILVFVLCVFAFIMGIFGICFADMDIMKIYNEFTEKISGFVDKNINELLENEHKILNKDICERCKNGEYGLRLKNVSWVGEIFETILILGIIFIVCYHFVFKSL